MRSKASPTSDLGASAVQSQLLALYQQRTLLDQIIRHLEAFRRATTTAERACHLRSPVKLVPARARASAASGA